MEHRGKTALVLVSVVVIVIGGVIFVSRWAVPVGHRPPVSIEHRTPHSAQEPASAAHRPPLFGSTVPPGARASGDASQTFRKMTSRVGDVDIVRLFNSKLPSPWRDSVAVAGMVPAVVSFKADPAVVLAGTYDAELTAWFANAPRSRPTYWAYYHEPEDQIENGDFDAADFQRAWVHIDSLASAAKNFHLRSTVILMCWTLAPQSSRDFTDYISPGMADVLAWDCYNHAWKRGSYTSPEQLLDRVVEASNEVGARWGVAELGSHIAVGDDGVGRAEWLRAVGAYAEERGAAFVTYFDSRVGGDFVLDDAASQSAWQELTR